MNTRCPFVLALMSLATYGQAQRYQLTEIVAAPGTYSAIDQCALNHQGHVAFVAAPTGSSNAGLYLWRGASATLIAPGSAQRTYLGVALANGRDPVTAGIDRVSGSPPTYFARRWPATYVGFPSPVGSSQRGDFNSAFGSLDINDAGYVAFGGLVDGSANSALFLGASTVTAPARVVTYPGVVGQFPQLAQDNSIVVRDNQQRIVVWRAGLSTIVADASVGFATVGQRPGISSNGALVSFAGIRNGLPRGVYVSVPTANGRQLLTIAGEGRGPFTGITDTERVGITMSGAMATVTFAGGTAAGNGIYAVDFAWVSRNGVLEALTMPPVLVAAIGDQVGGRTISTVNLYDQPNNCGSVVFRAGFGGSAAAVVLAQRNLPAPMFTARVQFTVVAGPGGAIPGAWGAAALTQLAVDLDAVCRRLFGLGIRVVDTTVIDDPHVPSSWFNVSGVSAGPLMEAFAEANPCTTAWRTDAINVVLVNSIVNLGGWCSFAMGSVANDNDLVVVQPNIRSGTAVGIAHELGHYFNLRHTHANHEGTGGGCAGGVDGDCVDDVPTDVAPNLTATCAQLDTDLAMLHPPTSAEYDVLLRNVMSYRCSTDATVTATCGQRLRVLKTALQFRSHVLETQPTPILTTATPASGTYPSGSTLALTGTDLPTSGNLLVRLQRAGSVVATSTGTNVNAVFANPLPPGDHCVCLYRDGQLVAFREHTPTIRPHLSFEGAPFYSLVARSAQPRGVMVLAFGSSLPQSMSIANFGHELWVNPSLTTATVGTDGNGYFTLPIAMAVNLSGTTISVQALDLGTPVPTFTNDTVIRFP